VNDVQPGWGFGDKLVDDGRGEIDEMGRISGVNVNEGAIVGVNDGVLVGVFDLMTTGVAVGKINEEGLGDDITDVGVEIFGILGEWDDLQPDIKIQTKLIHKTRYAGNTRFI
jgi:hypothetical protein